MTLHSVNWDGYPVLWEPKPREISCENTMHGKWGEWDKLYILEQMDDIIREWSMRAEIIKERLWNLSQSVYTKNKYKNNYQNLQNKYTLNVWQHKSIFKTTDILFVNDYSKRYLNAATWRFSLILSLLTRHALLRGISCFISSILASYRNCSSEQLFGLALKSVGQA